MAAQCGSNAAAFECDVTDWQALERAVEGTVERFGGIDVVMANAGIAPAGMVRSVDPARLRAHARDQPARRLADRARQPAPRDRAQGLRARDRVARGRDPRRRAWPPTPPPRRVPRRSPTPCASRSSTWAWTWASPTSASSTRTWCAATDAHPALGRCARHAGGRSRRPIRCRRWARRSWRGWRSAAAGSWCHGWGRALLVLRTALVRRSSTEPRLETAAEADRLFQQDVASRGAEAASAPIGAGGEAARQREAAGST